MRDGDDRRNASSGLRPWRVHDGSGAANADESDAQSNEAGGTEHAG